MRNRAEILRPPGRPCVPAAFFALLLLSASCAATPKRPPGDLIVLLPDQQGKTGKILVTGARGERLLDKPGQALAVAPDSAPGEPFLLKEEEVRSVAGPALDALPSPPVRFILYFRHDTTELTAESRAQLRILQETIRERSPVDISVVGHTDTMGTRNYNHPLSLSRARAVAALLVQGGVDPTVLEITSHGEDNPLVPTGDEVLEPRNRRVEVTVR